MTTLVWDNINARKYEAGVDHGVLYPIAGEGVVWNGLISIEEDPIGGESNSYAVDGVTYLTTVNGRDYKATVTAFSAPREFLPCVGDLEVVPGFILTRQPRQLFSFSYRTGKSDGYKLHLVYNVTASPTSNSRETTNDTPQPVNLEWEFNAVPLGDSFYRPTAHFTVDSTKATPWGLAALEAYLYGTSDTDPLLPEIENVLDILVNTPSPGIITEPISEPI